MLSNSCLAFFKLYLIWRYTHIFSNTLIGAGIEFTIFWNCFFSRIKNKRHLYACSRCYRICIQALMLNLHSCHYTENQLLRPCQKTGTFEFNTNIPKTISRMDVHQSFSTILLIKFIMLWRSIIHHIEHAKNDWINELLKLW